jgi:SAM-dependent methyltransferase
MPSICSACAAIALEPHLRVRGSVGPQGLIPSTSAFGSALADIARCVRCGHMQVDPMPDESALASAYADAASEDYMVEEAGQRATARRALDRIERYAARRGSLLDLGCWVGYLMSEARDRGWRTLGVEPSEFAAARARRLGLDVINGDLLTADLPTSAFDAVVMGDVIEHLVDPGAALRRISSLSAPSGVLWLALPDAGSRTARAMGRRWWSVLPTHVQYFTRHSLTTLLARNGYEVLEISTAPKVFTVRYYLDRIGGYSPPVARGLVRGAELVGVAERMWGPDFRDRIAVIARVGDLGLKGSGTSAGKTREEP